LTSLFFLERLVLAGTLAVWGRAVKAVLTIGPDLLFSHGHAGLDLPTRTGYFDGSAILLFLCMQD
jgi:hypothetical protein